MHAVLKQIACHSVAEAVEEIHADTDEREDDPRPVAEQVTEGLEGELLSTYRLQSLFGHESASQCSHRCQDSEKGTEHGILVLLCSSHQFLKVRDGEQGNEAHRIGTNHTEGGELVLLVVITGHHTEHRTVRHVDGSIYHHHHQIECICPDALAHRSKLRSVKQQGEDQTEGNCPEDEPGTIGAPAALGTVCQGSHDGVGDHIKHSCDEHQRRRIGNGQSEDVRKEQGKGY